MFFCPFALFIKKDIGSSILRPWSTSPRAESYRQSVVLQFMEWIEPSKIAQQLGFSKQQCAQAPDYLKDLDHVIAPQVIARAQHLLKQYEDLCKGLPSDNYEELDWDKAATLYPELFGALANLIATQEDCGHLFVQGSQSIDPQWQSDHKAILDYLKQLSYALDYERRFMDLKPEIRTHIERLFWQASKHTIQAIGCTDHFVKIQNLAFAQLERLAAYRKMKRKFVDDGQLKEGIDKSSG
jgi:hypothetical protein